MMASPAPLVLPPLLLPMKADMAESERIAIAAETRRACAQPHATGHGELSATLSRQLLLPAQRAAATPSRRRPGCGPVRRARVRGAHVPPPRRWTLRAPPPLARPAAVRSRRARAREACSPSAASPQQPLPRRLLHCPRARRPRSSVCAGSAPPSPPPPPPPQRYRAPRAREPPPRAPGPSPEQPSRIARPRWLWQPPADPLAWQAATRRRGLACARVLPPQWRPTAATPPPPPQCAAAPPARPRPRPSRPRPSPLAAPSAAHHRAA